MANLTAILIHPANGQKVSVAVGPLSDILKRHRISVQRVADRAMLSRGAVSDVLNDRPGLQTINPAIEKAAADLLSATVGGWSDLVHNAASGGIEQGTPPPDTAAPTVAPDSFPWSDVFHVVQEYRARIRSGVVSAEAGMRKCLAVCEQYAAYLRAGLKPDKALAGAWYTAVVARELGAARDLVSELYRAKFRRTPLLPRVTKHPLPVTTHPAAAAMWPLAVAGCNIWVTGDPDTQNAGSGKSWAARRTAEHLPRHDENGQPTGEIGRPWIVVPGNDGVEMIDFFGGWRFVEENGVTVQRYHYGFLPHAMKVGAVLISEEPTAIRPGVFLTAQQPLEERDLYIMDTGETVHAHPDFLVICADNTHGQGDGPYVARNVMDPAFLDRFAFVEFGPMPADIETMIVGNRAADLGLTIS